MYVNILNSKCRPDRQIRIKYPILKSDTSLHITYITMLSEYSIEESFNGIYDGEQLFKKINEFLQGD